MLKMKKIRAHTTLYIYQKCPLNVQCIYASGISLGAYHKNRLALMIPQGKY